MAYFFRNKEQRFEQMFKNSFDDNYVFLQNSDNKFEIVSKDVFKSIKDGTNNNFKVRNDEGKFVTFSKTIAENLVNSASTVIHMLKTKISGDVDRLRIEKVVFSETAPETYQSSFDVSEKDDGSIMAYVVEDPDFDTENGQYTDCYINEDGHNQIYDTEQPVNLILYIVGNNIYANEDSTALFGEYYDDEKSDDDDYYCNYAEMRYLSSIEGLDKLNTSKVKTMKSMFDMQRYIWRLKNCVFTSLDVSNFNTSNVTDMSYMFRECESLTSLDVSNFNTSNVTDMSYMFDWCESLTSLDVSNFNTSNVTDMSYMFDLCSSLTSIKWPSVWDMSKVTNSTFDLSYTLLTRENILLLYKSLPTASGTCKTIKLSSTSYGYLSSDDIKKFTDKGYTVTK